MKEPNESNGKPKLDKENPEEKIKKQKTLRFENNARFCV